MIGRNSRLYVMLRNARSWGITQVKGLRRVHPTTSIHPSCEVARDFVTEEYVFIGPRCSIPPGCRVGRYTMFAPEVAIVGDDHPITEVGVPMQFAGRPPQTETTIGRDVWIGQRTVVRRGVRIGDGAIVGAASVVTKDIPDFEIWVGNPARFLRRRFTDPAAEAVHRSMLARGDVKPSFAAPLAQLRTD